MYVIALTFSHKFIHFDIVIYFQKFRRSNMKYKTFCKRYYLMLLVSSTFIVSSSVFTCGNGQTHCDLSQWGHWSNCTTFCGGGFSLRIKTLCCNTSYKTIEKCATDCNITTKDYFEKKVCGLKCVNGVFRQNKCQCPSRFTGKCCETDIAKVPVTTKGFITSSRKTEITNACEQGCKFGECKNGKCSCMAFYKGNSCQKPEPWFIVATSILGTILMTMIVCCVCCFCFGYGKKFEPGESETRVK